MRPATGWNLKAVAEAALSLLTLKEADPAVLRNVLTKALATYHRGLSDDDFVACVWTHDDDPTEGESWHTGCGGRRVVDGSLREHEFFFCPRCGGRIEARKASRSRRAE